MNGKKALIDSNIIIYLSKQDLPLNFFDALDDLYISIITYMEILGYAFESLNEEKYIRELLGIFGVIYIDQEIADTTINIRKKSKIKLPDAIIAATAISEGLDLVTRNVEDFKNIDVKLINPFQK
ncbi:hypothetical protein BuS5_03615 [Desulfosarcina sp. BuS5]|uniref:type II toxin-antitoxin system VapC family toxin n=1 Tax=Desulfosarcina sp. BuS5 TaxID=933262 RepID=UPI002377D527|nr:type II toxin-antitoxin system VapC family toxin [Desulfosarcina sp. BuS5]WDN90644.1 hypothetical protein BuS5_03615 [Desulfosarcina sp. BuS5]